MLEHLRFSSLKQNRIKLFLRDFQQNEHFRLFLYISTTSHNTIHTITTCIHTPVLKEEGK